MSVCVRFSVSTTTKEKEKTSKQSRLGQSPPHDHKGETKETLEKPFENGCNVNDAHVSVRFLILKGWCKDYGGRGDVMLCELMQGFFCTGIVLNGDNMTSLVGHVFKSR